MIRLIQMMILVVIAGVFYAEARKGPEAEKLRGTSLGFVPYDFRPQSLGGAPRAYWDPDDPRVFTGRAAPIGWSLNLAAIVDRMRRL